MAKDDLAGAVALSGLAAAIQVVRFPPRARRCDSARKTAICSPQGDTGTEADERRLNAIGLVSLAAEIDFAGLKAVLNQQSFRRPPRRRALPWRRP